MFFFCFWEQMLYVILVDSLWNKLILDNKQQMKPAVPSTPCYTNFQCADRLKNLDLASIQWEMAPSQDYSKLAKNISKSWRCINSFSYFISKISLSVE